MTKLRKLKERYTTPEEFAAKPFNQGYAVASIGVGAIAKIYLVSSLCPEGFHDALLACPTAQAAYQLFLNNADHWEVAEATKGLRLEGRTAVFGISRGAIFEALGIF